MSRTTRYVVRVMRLPCVLAMSATLAACMSARPPLGLPDARVDSFDGFSAHGPDCRTLALRSTLRDPDLHTHPSIPFGCATYSNLAAQLARPEDLAAPAPYAGTDGTAAARGVQRYEHPPALRATSQDSGPATSSVGQ